MMRITNRTYIAVLFCGIITLASLIPTFAAAPPKNIILLIGDGMGIGPIMATRISEGGPGYKLNMDKMPEAALMTTYSANSLVTDSAAAATALATGVKTDNGMLGLTPDKQNLRSILEAAESIGKSTGLVTTVTITHATPAGFCAHVKSRGEEPTIAEQMAGSNIEVLLGGGKENFIPQEAAGSKRKDSQDLLKTFKSKGYAVAEDKASLLAADSPKLVGLFTMGYMTTQQDEPSVAEMAGKAIDALSKDRDGFFLMVEGGQIDLGGHANDIRKTIDQTVKFDKAVATALDFARKDRNTLVVVTADHDTGGLAVKDNAMKLKDMWIDGGHTGNPVQLYAFGPGSQLFEGLMDNTDVPKTFAKLWKVKIGLVSSVNIKSPANLW